MGKLSSNPFFPGTGKVPHHRAGHEEAAVFLEACLEDVLNRRAGDIIVLYGPRGNGKTVLLGELRDTALKRGMNVVSLQSDSMAGGAKHVARLLAPRNRVSLFGGIKKLMGGAFGYSAGVEFKDTPTNPVTVALKKALEKSPLVLIIDEAHVIPPEAGRAILHGAQDCINSKLPLLLAMAGTPDLPYHFRKMGASFWERCQKLRIGRLESDKVTREAFSVPAEETGLPIDEDALVLLVRESQRYPYFVQYLGKAAWDVADKRKGDGNRRITLQDAQQGTDASKNRIMDFYKERYAEARDLLLLKEAVALSDRMVSLGEGESLPGKELASVLREVTSDEAALNDARNKLAHLGMIWETPKGDWEAGIPSLCSYFSKRGVE